MTTLLHVLGPRRGSVILVYALLLGDNLVSIALPASIGYGLDGVLRQDYLPLALMAAVWLVAATLSGLRQSLDTRVFTSLSSNFAASVAAEQSAEGRSLSMVSARSNLSREVISFFGQDLPMMVRGGVSALGALAILFFYDLAVAGICAVALIPTLYANLHLFGRARRVHNRLNNRLEREIVALAANDDRLIRRHYLALSRRRIQLSDREALTSFVMRITALVAMTAVMLDASRRDASPGDIFATISYALIFFNNLSDAPLFVGGISRLRDILARLSDHHHKHR